MSYFKEGPMEAMYWGLIAVMGITGLAFGLWEAVKDPESLIVPAGIVLGVIAFISVCLLVGELVVRFRLVRSLGGGR